MIYSVLICLQKAQIQAVNFDVEKLTAAEKVCHLPVNGPFSCSVMLMSQ